MKILAFEKTVPGAATPPAELLADEARAAWALHRAGIVRALHFRADRREAVLEMECANETEAREALATLPLVRAGLAHFELVSLVPYDGFERLFSHPGEIRP